jgi:hypothetical protein
MKIQRLVEWVLEQPYFGEDAPIPATYQAGDIPLVVVVGQNGGGKSFFRRLWVEGCWEADDETIRECIDVSMEKRVGDDYSSGVKRALIFGSEQIQSTSDISRHVISNAISTAQSRSHPVCVVWDEPCIGMTPETALGAAQTIMDFTRNADDHVQGTVAISNHSTFLEALHESTLHPHYVCLGDQQIPSLQGWVDRDIEPESLETLHHRTSDRRDDLQTILED